MCKKLFLISDRSRYCYCGNVQIPVMNKSVLFIYIALFTSCAPASYISSRAKTGLLHQPPFTGAHVGISVFDVAANRFLYNYQSQKYFTPASNTKIFTLYAGMKYLKDSLEGMRYRETSDSIFIYPTGDPTLLHPDFKNQPVIQKLQSTTKKLVIVDGNWDEEALGAGWSWGDYNSAYMAERSPFPVYGNVIKWVQVTQRNTQPELEDSMQTFVFSEPEVNWKVKFKEDTLNRQFRVKRKKDENYFEISQGREGQKEQDVPFVTNRLESALELLKDTISNDIVSIPGNDEPAEKILYSQPADSLFRIMMYRSDNFFAEQVLLMAGLQKLGIMNDDLIIDTLLASDLAGLPQKPSWVDGSGLSRYNLFTPEDFVWILNKMSSEFGFERLKHIFPGGGTGTLANYYKKDIGYIYAKTGSLSGQIALSGFLISAKNKILTFSVLVNNFRGSPAEIRLGVEAFLHDVRMKY